MKHIVWLIVGWLGISVSAALAHRLLPYHIVPDVGLIVAVFLALRREPIPMALSALALGYFTGRLALAPVGLCEVSLILCSVWAYRGSGSVDGSGSVFFGIMCGAMVCVYHVLIFGLLLLVRGEAAFASWATASLIPTAASTFFVATLMHRPMEWLDRLVAPAPRSGLSWR